jgi:signal transduction histidine kinase
LQQWAERLIYGRRTPAYEVLAEVSALSGDAGRSAGSLQSLARIVGESLAVPTVMVTVEFADSALIDYSWPKPTTWNADIPQYRIPIGYRGARVGFLTIPTESQRLLSPDRRRLLSDLARAAGVILHNAKLTSDLENRLRATEARSAEIRASRWRIVATQEGERRDLERDLHDDAQPSLTAVRLSLGLLAHLVKTGDTQAVRGAFEQTSDQVDAALRSLRHTLDRLNPQTLTREGLVAALRERADGLGCAVRFEVDGEMRLRRFAPAVEMTIYYCCSEAVQNAAKHSPGAAVTVSLTLEPAPGRVCFVVADQGPGFEPSRVQGAGGLQNMADRISVAGGFLQVRSTMGAGTRISGWVPVASPGPDAMVAGQGDRV